MDESVRAQRIAPLLARMHQAYGLYVDVDDGWLPIIVTLDKRIAKIDPHYRILQIKEKFGGLRFYYELSDNVIGQGDIIVDELVEFAEYVCWSICEKCGAYGTLRTERSWVKTLCDSCDDDVTQLKYDENTTKWAAKEQES